MKNPKVIHLKMKQSLCGLVLIGIVLTNSTLTLASNTDIRERQLEEALLQQLHSSIVSALKSIYKTEYVMFGCKQISSINTLVTLKNQDKEIIRADAMHGGRYFELTISLCNVGSKGDYQKINLTCISLLET